MKTKLCALLMVMAMLLTMLGGCGSSSATSTTGESSAEQSVASEEIAASEEEEEIAEETETPAEEAEAPAEEAEAEVEEDDGISKYVTPSNIEELIAGRASVSLPIAEEGTSLTFWTGSPSQDATITTWNDSTAAAELESITGVHIEFIEVAPPSQSESLTLMFASGDYPNILNYAITGSYSVSYLIENEVAIDLADMMEEYAPSYSALMEADPALYLATVDDEGQIGGLAGYQYNAFTTTGAIVRADWVEAVGMSTDELDTIDEYYEFLTAVKNAGLCEYPMPLRYDASISGCPFLAAMGGYAGAASESSAQSFYYDDSDTLVYSYITDTYKEYITLMAQWYAEGLITRDLLNSDMLDSSDIASGSYAIFWQDCQFMDTWIEAGQVNDSNFSLVGISEPLLEEGQVVGHGDITDISINLIICTSCDQPEIALQWLDYHFSEEGSILCQYGLEGEGLTYDADGSPNYSELISNNPDGLSTDNALNAYAININMYAKNGTTLRAAYNEIQQEALNAWNDCREVTKSSFVNLFTLNTEETETVQQYYTDISTYVAEQIGKFLVGDSSIEENWDSFVATVESMGIDNVIAAYESAGERYFARLD